MGGFSVYAAIGDAFAAAIISLEARIEALGIEMAEQAELDAQNYTKKAAFQAVVDREQAAYDNKVYQGIQNGGDGTKVDASGLSTAEANLSEFEAGIDDGGGRSVSILALDMQRFIQEWSFLLTLATNSMKTFGDGLLSVARNL
jgi:hypothetical protein